MRRCSVQLGLDARIREHQRISVLVSCAGALLNGYLMVEMTAALSFCIRADECMDCTQRMRPLLGADDSRVLDVSMLKVPILVLLELLF